MCEKSGVPLVNCLNFPNSEKFGGILPFDNEDIDDLKDTTTSTTSSTGNYQWLMAIMEDYAKSATLLSVPLKNAKRTPNAIENQK